MSWNVNLDGPTELNAPKGKYLIEIHKGSSVKENEHGQVEPRKDKNGAPFTLYSAKLITMDNGDTSFAGEFINVIVKHDDKGARIFRNMHAALVGATSGAVSVTDNIFDGKQAWVEYEHRNGWDNLDHTTWQPKNAVKIDAAAVSGETVSGGSDETPGGDFDF